MANPCSSSSPLSTDEIRKVLEDLPVFLYAMDRSRLYVDPETHAKALELLTEQGGTHIFEAGLRRKDGTEIICELSSVARRNTSGEIEAFYTFFRDITVAKRAREALAESEEKFRTIAQNTPVGIGLVAEPGSGLF